MIMISSTAIQPYRQVTTLSNDISIFDIKGTYSIGTEEKYLYLIIQDDWYDELRVKVEGETETGIGMYIAITDALGKPLGWKKELVFKPAYANHTTLVFPFVYKWNVINNIFMIKDKHGYAELNIYGVRYVDT